MLAFVRRAFGRKSASPRKRTPNKKRPSPPKRRKTSPSVRRSAALGPFWVRGSYAYRQGPLRRTFS